MRMPKSIEITRLTGPEEGWPIAAHCNICRKTVMVWSPYTCKPKDGDFYMLMGTCLDEDLHIQHSMYPQHDYPWPQRMGPRPEEWTPEAYRAYWNILGVVEVRARTTENLSVTATTGKKGE